MLEHNANSSKTQTKDMVSTGSNSYWCPSKSVENKLDQQTVVFIVAVNQDKVKKESSRVLQIFLRQKFSFVRKLMAMLLQSFKKKRPPPTREPLHCMSTYFEHKKNPRGSSL